VFLICLCPACNIASANLLMSVPVLRGILPPDDLVVRISTVYQWLCAAVATPIGTVNVLDVSRVAKASNGVASGGVS